MTLIFDKYHGCGNDFIILDNSKGQFDESKLTEDIIRDLCNRRYGIGADGLMMIQPSIDTDFKMYYANADGKESTMCGNGGRCIVAYAASLGIIDSTTECTFEAIDGRHTATIDESGYVNLRMSDVDKIIKIEDDYVLDTGSPHYVTIVEGIEDYPVYAKGRAIRNMPSYHQAGINVNFVEINDGNYRIRTYERGVEAETEACGTGVTAAALVLNTYFNAGSSISILTNGGLLTVKIGTVKEGSYHDILLCGPATYVYSGSVELSDV